MYRSPQYFLVRGLGVAGCMVLLCGTLLTLSPSNGSMYVSQTASTATAVGTHSKGSVESVARERETGGELVPWESVDSYERQCPFIQAGEEVVVWFGSHAQDMSLDTSSSVPVEVVVQVDIPQGTYAIDVASVPQMGSWSMVVQNESGEVIAVSRPTLGGALGVATIERVVRAVTVEGGVYSLRLYQGEDAVSRGRVVPFCARLTPLR